MAFAGKSVNINQATFLDIYVKNKTFIKQCKIQEGSLCVLCGFDLLPDNSKPKFHISFCTVMNATH